MAKLSAPGEQFRTDAMIASILLLLLAWPHNAISLSQQLWIAAATAAESYTWGKW